MTVVLETPRLRLRQMLPADADRLLGIFADPAAMRYCPSTKDRSEREAWIARHRRGYAEHGIGLWIAEFADTGQFAGQCGLVVQEVDGRQEVELGYLFLRCHWGHGLATEAARLPRLRLRAARPRPADRDHDAREPRLAPSRREDGAAPGEGGGLARPPGLRLRHRAGTDAVAPGRRRWVPPRQPLAPRVWRSRWRRPHASPAQHGGCSRRLRQSASAATVRKPR